MRERQTIYSERPVEKRKKYIDRIDLNIWMLTIALCCFGAVMLFSASSYECSMSQKYNYDSMYLLKRQSIFIILGLLCMFFSKYVNYHILEKLAWMIYAGGIACIMLLLTPMGISVNGAKRWLRIGPIQFQVAEAVKVALIVFLAYMVKKYYRCLKQKKMVIYIWIAGGIPTALLFKISNDLSSSLVLAGITFGVSMVCTKAWWMHLLVLGVVCVMTGLYVWNIARDLPTQSELNQLPFRVGRIAAWIAPEKYARNQGYQVLQGLYAIGRGGFWGTGLGNSIQKLGPIPEAHNDMIFSIICEELGMFGAICVLGLITSLLYQILRVIMHSENIFGAALGLGVFFHIAIQTVINVAVNVKCFPNTGLPLPFFSYGGTSVCFLLIEIAFVLSVEQRNMLIKGKRMFKKENVYKN